MFHICSAVVVVREDLEMEDSDSDDLANLLDQGEDEDEDEDEGERLNTEEEAEEENWVTDNQILERANSDSEGGEEEREEEDDREEQREEESRVLKELPSSCSTPCLLCKQSQVEGVRLGPIYR